MENKFDPLLEAIKFSASEISKNTVATTITGANIKATSIKATSISTGPLHCAMCHKTVNIFHKTKNWLNPLGCPKSVTTPCKKSCKTL
jgi:hypothetical protein